ncbi:hydroxymethylbilane synthase [Deminuibacter soli]|uniref:Hydroxymethylbilane synthase n=1 Tax=Deminuibacter soli TaxID=2291815 RepID=A0A3E1NP79_9BACT|nr:hydroxymethylbilane synthase [Deminuibacter soli]RFM29732.1 hydroxymethylbilane synthase [Deminuibacter soli]
MSKILRIGTRDSQLAVWQATLVQQQLLQLGVQSELVYIKSEGDIDLVTPLYAIGVQGVFTRTLDAALLGNKIDIAVHSMKDVPTQLAQGIQQAAVLQRASYKDLLVFKGDTSFLNDAQSTAVIATSSIRRKAQWLSRYPNHTIENLRGNVNTRLQKVAQNPWNGAIFAAAGLERIAVRPAESIELDWMLPAPAQGAIMVVCRENDTAAAAACAPLHHPATAICTRIERDFLKTLMGGCSTPISALAQIQNDTLYFEGNIFSLDGKQKAETKKSVPYTPENPQLTTLGTDAAREVLAAGGKTIAEAIRNATV